MPTIESSLRRAQPQDCPTILEFLSDREEAFLIYPEAGYPVRQEQIEQLIRKRVDPTVLEIDGCVAGFSGFYSYKKDRSAFIGNVAVARKYRGYGLGRKLVEYMIDRAFIEHDLPEVRISAVNRNTPALLLYADLGFKPYRIKPIQDYCDIGAADVHMKLERDSKKVSRA